MNIKGTITIGPKALIAFAYAPSNEARGEILNAVLHATRTGEWNPPGCIQSPLSEEVAEEIERLRSGSAAARENGRSGGRPKTQPKPNLNPTETQNGKPNLNPIQTQPKPNLNPTKTQLSPGDPSCATAPAPAYSGDCDGQISVCAVVDSLDGNNSSRMILQSPPPQGGAGAPVCDAQAHAHACEGPNASSESDDLPGFDIQDPSATPSVPAPPQPPPPPATAPAASAKPAKPAKVFRRPTVEEVGAYCAERDNGLDPQAFVDFYESKGWVVGRSPMKDWKAAVRTWERSEYGAGSVASGGGRGDSPLARLRPPQAEVSHSNSYDFKAIGLVD